MLEKTAKFCKYLVPQIYFTVTNNSASPNHQYIFYLRLMSSWWLTAPDFHYIPQAPCVHPQQMRIPPSSPTTESTGHGYPQTSEWEDRKVSNLHLTFCLPVSGEDVALLSPKANPSFSHLLPKTPSFLPVATHNSFFLIHFLKWKACVGDLYFLTSHYLFMQSCHSMETARATCDLIV